MKLCDRIKALRIEKSFTQKEFGRLLGVSEVSVRCWENGSKNPSLNALISMASLFNISTDSLLGISVAPKDMYLLRDEEKLLLRKYRSLDAHGRNVIDTICDLECSRIESCNQKPTKIIPISTKSPNRYIPKYITPSAAGSSVPLGGAEFEMILVDNSVPDDADFAVRIQGNSMYPYINDGDTVYVKKDCDLSIGDVGIFCVDGAMYCKQYYIDKERNLILLSANPDQKQTNVLVPADSSSNVRCYGKVLLGGNIELPDYDF